MIGRPGPLQQVIRGGGLVAVHGRGGRLRIFISYRRRDTSAQAGRLCDDLGREFGRDGVFMDVDAIVPGSDFVDAIDEAIRTCDVLLALIGPAWLAPADDANRGLHHPDDVVRRELEIGLNADVRVIPVLVNGATMPSAADLPATLAPLTRRHAHEISDRRWRSDVEALVRAVKSGGSQRKEAARARRWGPLLAGLGAVVACVGVVVALARDDFPASPRSESATTAASPVLFQDDFSTVKWPVDAYIRYEDGAYHVRPRAPGPRALQAPLGPVDGDVRVEVHAQSLEGGTTEYGVFCRGGTPGDSGYQVALNSNGGAWRILRVDPGSSPSTRQLAPATDETPTAASFRWNAPNRISLACVSKQDGAAVALALEINGELVAAVEDPQGLPEGTVGLFFSARGVDADVRYDDFVVRRLGS